MSESIVQGVATRIGSRTVKFFLCPCGDTEEHRYEHLAEGQRAGPWYCDSCHVGWFLTIREGFPVLEDRGHRMAEFLVRLKLDLADGASLVLVVPSMWFRQDGVVPTADDYDEDKEQFHFEEHQCPVNFLRRVKEVFLDGEQDPHGVFELVGLEGGEW